MTSPPLGTTHGRTTSDVASHHCLWTSSHSRTASGVACHHRPWMANTVERCQAWHAIIAFGQHTRSNDVGLARHHCLWLAHMLERRRAWHAIIAYGQHTRSNDVGRGMTSPPLACMHSQTMPGVACHHRPWTARTVEQRRAWHDIIALGQHTRSNDVRRGMTSLPFESTHGRTTSSVAYHYHLWDAHMVK